MAAPQTGSSVCRGIVGRYEGRGGSGRHSPGEIYQLMDWGVGALFSEPPNPTPTPGHSPSTASTRRVDPRWSSELTFAQFFWNDLLCVFLTHLALGVLR